MSKCRYCWEPHNEPSDFCSFACEQHFDIASACGTQPDLPSEDYDFDEQMELICDGLDREAGFID